MQQTKATKAQIEAATALFARVIHHDATTRNVVEVWAEFDAMEDRWVAITAEVQVREYIQSAKAEYRKLVEDLQAVEKRLRDAMNGDFVYLTDEAVDRENVLVDGMTERSVGFWPAMATAAASAAGARAEELGIDLHRELGRVVY